MKIVAYYAPELDESSAGIEMSGKVDMAEYFFFPLPDLAFPLPVGSIIRFSDIGQDVEDFSHADIWFKVVLIEYEPAKQADTILLRLSFEDSFDVVDIDDIIKCLRAKGKKE